LRDSLAVAAFSPGIPADHNGLPCSSGDPLVLGHQLLLGLDVVGVNGNAIYRTDLDTLRGFIVADAFGAKIGVDFIDLVALVDRAVRTFRFTDIAVDALIGNHKRHDSSLLVKFSLE
jgi:hypothetical protein